LQDVLSIAKRIDRAGCAEDALRYARHILQVLPVT